MGHQKITVVNDQNINTVSTVLQYCTTVLYSTGTVLVCSLVLYSTLVPTVQYVMIGEGPPKKVVGVLVQYFQYYSTTSTVLYQLKGYCSAQY